MKYEDFIDLAERNITDHSKFMWSCYGDTAYTMDSWDGNYDGCSISMVYDLVGLRVYQMTVYDYKKELAYRYFSPLARDAYFEEVKSRNSDDIAWTADRPDKDIDVKYTDLESYDDFLEKATAIVHYEDYDTRVSIPIDLPEDELMNLFKMAHEADMTFNEYVTQILRDAFADSEFVERLKVRHGTV
jgi:hypothetical protein